MAEYSPVRAPLMAWFSGALYRDVARNWTGVSFQYLFVLVAISWLVTMALLWTRMAQLVDRPDAQAVIRQIPAISITSGRLSIDKPSPYFIRDPATGKPVVVIDTSDKPLELEESDERVLVTATRVVARKSAFETREYDLSSISSFRFDQNQVRSWLKALQTWLPPVLFLLCLPFVFAGHALQAVVYGAIGLAFSGISKANLTYGALMRLSVTAMTPVIVLSTIQILAGINIPYWSLLAVLVVLVYLFIAVRSSRPPDGAPSQVG
jgi:hypothetical protein